MAALAVSLTGVSFAAKDVLLHGHWLQVIESNTSGCTAKVVKHRAIRNRADQHFVCEPMGANAASCADANVSISVNLATSPEPARIRELNLAPEAGGQTFTSSSSEFGVVTVSATQGIERARVGADDRLSEHREPILSGVEPSAVQPARGPFCCLNFSMVTQ